MAFHPLLGKKGLVTEGEPHQTIACWSRTRLSGRTQLAGISCPLCQGKISIVSMYGIISSTCMSAKWSVFDRARVLVTVPWCKKVSKQTQFPPNWNRTTSHGFL
jgi:hypothetical protein